MDKQDYATLEISLSASASAGQYSAVLKYRSADTDGTGDRDGHNEEPITFNLDELRRMSSIDDKGYGEKLSKSLFVRGVKEVFSQACAVVFNDNKPLRLRLELRPDAWELHDLRWETLRHPEDSSRPLLTDNRIYFSRYLGSQEWRKVESKRFPETLRILVVIANPSNGTKYKLAKLSIEEELQRIRESLTTNNHRLTIVCDQQEGKPATLQSIKEHLQKDYDVFYLLAHGKITEKATNVYLEHDDRTCDPTRVEDFVNAFKDLPHLPRLVILASCESAGSGEVPREQQSEQPQIPDPMLTAFGPRLVQAGVPAVVAMQGRIKIETAQTFLQTFFGQIHEHGVLDKAMAIARDKVRDEEYHWWRPVLFMRLRSGSIYYKPHWQGNIEWKTLTNRIEMEQQKGWEKCTPILGAGVYQWISGTPVEFAQSWAREKPFYPMISHETKDLPRVAQYHRTKDEQVFHAKFLKYMQEHLLKKYFGEENSERNWYTWLEVKQTIDQVQKERCRKNNKHKEIHDILAELGLPLYLETNPYNLLEVSLERNKETRPEVVICPWKEGIKKGHESKKIEGTQKKPLVYYLLGTHEEPKSLVLTEDDYFDYLIGVTESKEIIPEYVRGRLKGTTLLFLGFQLEDWSFRVILRSIVRGAGAELLKEIPHFAVQLEPDDEVLEHPKRALEYLKLYFRKTLNADDVSIYWGSTEDFIKELADKMNINRYWSDCQDDENTETDG